MTDQQSPVPELSSFYAWVYDPREFVRWRGFSTDILVVRQRSLEVVPSRAGSVVRAGHRVTYGWPAAVVEYLRPLGGAGILVDIGGNLGRVAVRGGGKGRLRAALVEAGFSVVETNHIGWEAPRRINREELGELAEDVPPCVVRRGPRRPNA